jgi:HEAT repeat protein
VPAGVTIVKIRILIAAGLLLSATGSAPADDAVIDSPMYRLPDLSGPPVEIVFPAGLRVLWLRALQRPDTEMRLKAANAIARAHERGMKDLDATVPALVAALDAPDQDAAVRIAAAQALIALDARRASASLLAEAQRGDIDLRETIEPALATWDYAPARAMWLKRLESPDTPARSLILGVRGLGAVKEARAAARLHELLRAPFTAAPVRLEAAIALGAIRDEGLENLAEELAARTGPHGLVARLAAAELLTHHRGPATIVILQRLARDQEPAVIVRAADRLIALGLDAALPVLDHLLASPTADVRSRGVTILFKSPTQEHVRALAGCIGDAHPDIRTLARKHLHVLAAKAELRMPIVDAMTEAFAGRDWRRLEQATILLTQLDHRPAAARLVELLTHDRPEVFVTAAWGLRKLAVRDTLPAVQAYVQDELGRLLANRPLPGRKNLDALIDHQFAQLHQFLGQQKHQPAEPLLRRFVAKGTKPGPEARAAAIWSLGLLHESHAIAPLTRELAARLSDVGTVPPEDGRVRRMAAIALGRMRAAEALPTLRKYWIGQITDDMTGNAAGWAIAQITDAALPPPAPIRKPYRDGFLTPLTGGS